MDANTAAQIVLGSQSPQRRSLLSRLVGPDRVRIVPPTLPAEPDFVDIATLADVDRQLLAIARLKYDDVAAQLAEVAPPPVIVCADTVIVGLDETERPVVLGKPPDDPDALSRTVRHWFGTYFTGQHHLAKTAVCVGRPGEVRHETIVTTSVWFRADALEHLDWYLLTGEPRGKAGGYAIQETGSLFVERIEGSLSNIVGLPLVETLSLLQQAEECIR